MAAALERRHGGAFIILPSGIGNPEGIDVHCKYVSEMDFADDFLRFWQACVKHANNRSEEIERMWNWRRTLLLTKAEGLAGLSAVDGCVVVDRRFNVKGFAGEIRTLEDKLAAAPRTLMNFKTNEPKAETELQGLGTRHRSAYRLCKAHPGVVAFVISQDGDLRIFCSDDQNVYGFERLHAWAQLHESR